MSRTLIIILFLMATKYIDSSRYPVGGYEFCLLGCQRSNDHCMGPIHEKMKDFENLVSKCDESHTDCVTACNDQV